MLSMKYLFVFISFFGAFAMCGCGGVNTPRTITYPALSEFVTSLDFMVKVNGQEVWTEKVGAGGHEDRVPQDPDKKFIPDPMEDLNVANFSCSGKQRIAITVSEDIQNYVIHPKNKHIVAEVKGREMIFCIDGPQQLYIEINALPHLAIFANPLEENIPSPDMHDVVYYEPGIHDMGDITLQSNQTIYIAGGAVVNANIRGEYVENVKILGRGCLNGNMRISSSKNVEVNGIFIRSTRGWTCTLTDCYNTVYENVKVFSYLGVYSLDGINPVSCKNVVINNCFIRTRDDCIAIKSPARVANIDTDSISITKCLLVGWQYADGVTLGFELQGGEVKNVFVRDCDIVRARGGGRTGGHSAFSIVCDGPSKVFNICFENIRVASDIEFKNLEIIITDGTLYGKGGIGSIHGVYMKDIYWENTDKPFTIQGYSSSQLVENVVFWNCYAGGKLITKPEDAEFQMEYVKAITFIPGGPFILDSFPNIDRQEGSNIP
jgi:hypothetical protein